MANKKAEKTTRTANWHPDFRDLEVLPDIKIIRTDFIVNLVAAIVGMTFLWMFVNQYFSISKKSSEIAELTQKIDTKNRDDRESFKLSQEFDQRAEPVRDLVKFYEAPLVPYELIEVLGDTCPDSLMYESLVYSPPRDEDSGYTITMKGVVRHKEDDGFQILADYVEMLEGLEMLKDTVDTIEARPLGVDDVTDLISFSITINVLPLK